MSKEQESVTGGERLAGVTEVPGVISCVCRAVHRRWPQVGALSQGGHLASPWEGGHLDSPWEELGYTLELSRTGGSASGDDALPLEMLMA